MSRFLRRGGKKAGVSPGTMVYIGEKPPEPAKITVIDYGPESFEEKVVDRVEECFHFKTKSTVTWINIDGLRDLDVIRKLGDCYGFHHLVLEDIVNTFQRSKLEDFGSYLFIVFKMLTLPARAPKIEVEQVSLILGDNFVISFQEAVGDLFDPVRERIRGGKGRIRTMGADYLMYSLIDSVVDGYFSILESFGETIEGIEETVVLRPTQQTLQSIHAFKKEMIFLRKSVWPMREVISALLRRDSVLITEPIVVYFRDVYDHTVQIIDNVETFRDTLASLLDIYMSGVSNRLNEVMKILTVFSTIFMPLTFLAGVYGMNFRFMPELHWKYGYLFAWLVMLGVVAVMLAFFKRRKWI
jgi:magnesium transporter